MSSVVPSVVKYEILSEANKMFWEEICSKYLDYMVMLPRIIS